MKIPHTIPALVLRFYTKEHSEESLEAQYKDRLLKSEDFSWDEQIESIKKTLANQCLDQIISDFTSFVQLVQELNRVGGIRHEAERSRWAENLAKYQEKKNEYDQRIATLSEKEKRKLRSSSIDDTNDDSRSKIDVELLTPVPDTFPQFTPINSVLDMLDGTDRMKVVEELDFKSIPLHIAIRQIPDEHYWERASGDRWPMVFVSDHGDSWRRLYMELYILDEIENFHPFEGDMDKLIGQLALVSPFVSNVCISNLIPSCYGMMEKGAEFSSFHHDGEMINKEVDEGFQTGTDAIKLGLDKPLTKEYDEIDDEPLADEEEAEAEAEAENLVVSKGRDNSHIDFSLCLHYLKNLVKLSLVYEMADIGMDWEKKYFEFTDVDCENLAKALSQCPTLEIFEFNRSQMTGEQCKVLVKNGLMLMPKLKSLNLSYQKIGNSGARAIARLITDQGSKVPKTLQSLFLARNQIKNKGAKALAFALTQNNHLGRLDLRLNLIRDSGGRDFGHALVKNRSLLCLNLAANRLTDKSAYVIGKMLFHNVALKEIDLSSNDFGKNGGQYLALGVRGNKHILKVDLRLTNIGLGFEYDVSQNTKKNIARAKISILERDLYDLKSPGPLTAPPDTGSSTHTGSSGSHKSAP